MRNYNYWSCSKLADAIRGAPKMKHATSKEWIAWDNSIKKASPFRYWLAEEGLDHIQLFVTWPARKIYDIKCYINNRWVTRTHALTADPRDIKRGQWVDLSSRFLPCLFNELVQFVEIELVAASPGQDYLDWAIALGDESPAQATAAREVKELYIWWTEIYRNRPDPMIASGWTDYCETADILKIDSDDVLYDGGTIIYNRLKEIEETYKNEDTEMLIRLIKIRDYLWT
jgi:hypothetical protein